LFYTAYTKAFETLDVATLFSGTSAANYDAEVHTSSIFNYNGVSYSESTSMRDFFPCILKSHGSVFDKIVSSLL